ncbi:hypothetical protein KKP04_14440 [Rhodomicrobium sp. Az07]|uniref:hypothetical protein n=1 Tax=Rhodomicrobium sp. Az07 TaxID=2839034 RepID=UPI001BE83BF1|nr:hypothetical protein [Rhodomicrobium sp. Az07]MBT3072055.1 hypothetical protein [Rhodomicrobium sp. Az07]
MGRRYDWMKQERQASARIMIRFNAWPIISLFLAGIGISGGLFLFALHAGSIDGIGLTTTLARQQAAIEASKPHGQGFAKANKAIESDKTSSLAPGGDFKAFAASAHDGPRPALIALPGEPVVEAITSE